MTQKTDKSKNKKLKHVKVYDQLYELIRNGTYQPGEQLPPETALASSMKVSRMTLRKALTLLQDDGLIKNVPGVGHFIRSNRPESPNATVIPTPNRSVSSTHPIYSYCTEPLDRVELEFRIEPPTESILDTLGQYSAAIVITDRWYHHDTKATAYSLSFIPIEVIAKLQIDLNDKTALQHFLEHTCYEAPYHCYRSCSYSTAGNFTAKNYQLSTHDSFLLVLENIYTDQNELLMSSKHYIPAELFRIELHI